MNIIPGIVVTARVEAQRIMRGKLAGPPEFIRVTLLLWGIAVVFFAICWLLHPNECDFSIFDDTISHFGKPQAHGGSLGFIAFHLGFATLCLFMFIAVKYRDRQLQALPGEKTGKATQLYVAGILGLVLSLIFPDSRDMRFGPFSYRKLHGAVVIIGIFCFAGAILHDTKKLWQLFQAKSKESNSSANTMVPKKLRPIAILAGIFGTGLCFMGVWEIRCYRDATLDKWPGEGIFSTALWEWIVFTYLIIFMFWYTLSLSSVIKGRGGVSTLRRWRME